MFLAGLIESMYAGCCSAGNSSDERGADEDDRGGASESGEA